MAASIRARLSFSLLVLPFIAFVATARLGAQATIAITGVITDASGGVLPGATVEVQAAGRRLAAAMGGADGRYGIDAPAGVPLELRVHLEGFAEQLIAIGGRTQALTRNVVLPVAGVSDTLIVTAARAPESRMAVTESVSAFTRRDLDALLTRQALLGVLVRDHADADDEAVADRSAHRVDDPPGEPQPVVERAAIGIVAMIGERRPEAVH